MKVEKKLAVFSRVAINEAEKRAALYLEKLNNEVDHDNEDAKNEAEKRADAEIEREKSHARHNINKEILSANLNSKKAVFELKQRLTNSLFDDVSIMLSDYVRTNQGYIIKLENDIKQVVPDFPGATYAKGNDNFIGGFIAVIENRQLLIDKSLIKLVNQAKEEFTGIKLSD